MNPKSLQALRKIFPQYIDDVGEQALKHSDEILDPKTLKRLSAEIAQEADQAIVPMGSGSRLEALMKAKQSAPDLDDLNLQKLAQTEGDDLARRAFQQGDDVLDTARRTDNARLVGEVADTGPSNFTMPDPNASVPMTRPNTMPAKVPEVMDSSLPVQLSKQPEDFIEAMSKELPKKGLNLGRAAGIGGGIAGAGYLANELLGGGDDGDKGQAQQAGMPQKRPEDARIPAPAQTKEDKPIVKDVISKVTNPQQTREEKVDSMSNYIKMLQEAQAKDDKNEFLTTMLRAAVQAGAALSMTKADYSGVEALEKQTKNIDKVKKQMDTDKMYRQMQEEAQMADPNSAVSKQVRALLIQSGYPANDKMSAKQLKDMGVNIYNLIGQQKAQEAKLKIEQSKASLSNEDKKKKFAQSLRKEVTTGALGKQYSNFVQAERISSALSEFKKNPSGYKDYATLMGGLKALQGDESVVREAEVRMGMSATSIFDSTYNRLQKLATGKMLTDNQRNEMVKTIEVLKDVGHRNYMDAVTPILEQAEMEGIEKSLILPKSLSSTEPSKKGGTSIKLPSQMKPNSVITTKSGKKYKVNQDGTTATEI
jgi:hypothetical protein